MDSNLFQLEIVGFGPVLKGSINVKPLTILIGPNNSGKSYSAKLIYSLLKASTEFPRVSQFFDKFFPNNITPDTFITQFRKIEENVTTLKIGEDFLVPSSIIITITHKVIDNYFNNNFKKELRRIFDVDKISSLINNTQNSIEIRTIFTDNEFKCVFKRYEFDSSESLINYSSIIIRVEKNVIGEIETKHERDGKNLSIILDQGAINIKNKRKELYELLRIKILNYIIDQTFGRFEIPHYYIPSGRSGIIEVQDKLISSIIRNLSYNGRTKFDMVNISGIILDYLANFTQIKSHKKAKYYKLAKNFEDEIINGEIAISNIGNIPELYFNQNNMRISLSRASSTVNQLAPIIVLLKYVVKQNSLIIIEEPEAHLHPKNQIILAKYIVQMINQGIKIILTTHSEFLLNQLSNYLLIGNLSEQKRVKILNNKGDLFLRIEDVSAYVFKDKNQNHGFFIEELPVSKTEGISDEDFLKVVDILYDENLKINRELEGEN
ncbi:MAG: AAA family ATPase [Candidatus Lokiarchaeota archaeon]|nr:AAA family ATPase [Candidatus Lokiarchaeota archaeon]